MYLLTHVVLITKLRSFRVQLQSTSAQCRSPWSTPQQLIMNMDNNEQAAVNQTLPLLSKILHSHTFKINMCLNKRKSPILSIYRL